MHICTCVFSQIDNLLELILGIYIGGGVPWHTKKRGVLGAGTAQKGGLRCGHNQKKGGLRHVYNPKKGEFRTDFVKGEGVRN